MKNILIIGAHFDDAELGAGGTAAKLVSEGKKVYKLTLTDNVTDFKQMNIKVAYDSSVKESQEACKILGVTEILDFIPARCSTLEYCKEIMQRVEKVIYDYNIDTVFMHFQKDMNQDHVEASRICLTASRHCDNVFAYQGNGYILDQAYYPTFFVDISNFIDKKKQALSKYGAEHNRYNRLFDANIERNHIWGYANQVEYAEGFHIIKAIIR
jgi:LmbE family N-acetylglucosaminyl deacetylase